MPIFRYKILNSKGKEEKGKINAGSYKSALEQLRKQGYLLEIKSEDNESKSFFQKEISFLKPRVKAREMAAFTRQFAVMINTGIPYDRALDVVLQETKNSTLQKILAEIKMKILEGQTLAQAMSAFPKTFDVIYISVVRIGEMGGGLAKTMLRQADFQEERIKLQGKLKTALIYPVIMMLLALGIVTFMINFILPKIIPIFEHFDAVLPWPTQAIILISTIFSEHGLIAFIVMVAIIMTIKLYINSLRGQFVYHKLLLKIPVLSKFLHRLYTFRFVQSIGTMLDSGVNMKDALTISEKATGNRVYEDAINGLQNDLTKKGFLLSQALKRIGLFNESVIQMIRVGEESGQLPDMLVKISDTFQNELKNTLEGLTALLEPLIILVMAVVVGFIVIAILLPMFQLNQFV